MKRVDLPVTVSERMRLVYGAHYMSQRTMFLDQAHKDLKRVAGILRKDGHPKWAGKVELLILDTWPSCLPDAYRRELLRRMKKGKYD